MTSSPSCCPGLNRGILGLFAFVACAMAAVAAFGWTQESREDERVFEMRTYIAPPGKLEALHRRFREHTTALFEKHGMTNIGYWTPTDAEGSKNTLIYLLAFPSMEAREASWKAFIDDPDWKKAYQESEKDGKLVEKVISVYLKPTDYSPIH